MKMLRCLLITLLFSPALMAQQYGGNINLRITFEGRPMVGYTITGTINKIDIGGKGVTDKHGEVTLRTKELPTPYIDVKGERTCGNNGSASFEVSGNIVYIASGNYHLELDKLIKSMHFDFGIEYATLMAAYGITGCDGSLGRKEDNLAPSKPYQTTAYGYERDQPADKANEPLLKEESTGTTQQTTTAPDNNSTTTQTKNEEHTSTADENKKKWDEESKRNEEERKKKQDQFHADWASGKTQAEGYQNQRAMHMNKIEKLNGKIAKKKEEQTKTKEGSKDHSDLSYEIRELELDKDLQQVKLDRVNKEIEKGNVMLNREERAPFETREDGIKAESKTLKEKQEAGILYGSTTGETPAEEEAEESEVIEEYTPAQIENLSTFNLKKLKLNTNTRLTKRNMKLKTKGSIMNKDKKAALESDIAKLNKLVESLEAELAKRKAAGEKEAGE